MTNEQKSVKAGQLTEWRERVQSLGLDPDIDAVNYPVLRTTHSLEEYKRWFNAPPYPNPQKSKLTVAQVPKLPDALMRRDIERHIAGVCVIEDPQVIKALEERVKSFHSFVQTAPDITVTETKPLIITKSGNVVYGTVTINNGGYINILAACHFECQTLLNVSGAQNTIQVLGIDGQNGLPGNSPKQPDQSGSGNAAECDCCGGIVQSDSTPGSSGTNGSHGGDAQSPGSAGQSGPTVIFTVKDSLPYLVSFLTQGGTGGRGGDGGNGAQGGQGGKGGDGTTCGAYFPGGSDGGPGGKGGNGGNATNGGDGGSAGNLIINVPPTESNHVAVTLGIAPGGEAGNRGLLGQGGPGGAGGSSGGKTGAPGAPGDADGNPGLPGNPGAKGSATINGSPVV